MLLSFFNNFATRIFMDMDKDFAQTFVEMTKVYQSSDFVDKEWPMKDGMYQQYSAFENDVQCASGTQTSIVML